MIILYRILGNNIPKRHGKDQTQKNLEFVLGHEDNFPDVEKAFLLNRICDREKAAKYREIIEGSGYRAEEIPFKPDEVTERNVGRYITNINQARNFCIRDGFGRGADIVMPFDGNSFIRSDGWEEMKGIIYDGGGYYYSDMWRAPDYDTALTAEPGFTEGWNVHGGVVRNAEIATEVLDVADLRRINSMLNMKTEPQLLFGKEHDKLFNEDMEYGNCDKVELLYKLGIRGIWDGFNPNLRKVCAKSKYFGAVKRAGWVIRLPSGVIAADVDNSARGRLRSEGCKAFTQEILNKYVKN